MAATKCIKACRHGQKVQECQNGEKCDLSDIDRGMIIGARQCDLSELLVFWDFHTQKCIIFNGYLFLCIGHMLSLRHFNFAFVLFSFFRGLARLFYCFHACTYLWPHKHCILGKPINENIQYCAKILGLCKLRSVERRCLKKMKHFYISKNVL